MADLMYDVLDMAIGTDVPVNFFIFYKGVVSFCCVMQIGL